MRECGASGRKLVIRGRLLELHLRGMHVIPASSMVTSLTWPALENIDPAQVSNSAPISFPSLTVLEPHFKYTRFICTFAVLSICHYHLLITFPLKPPVLPTSPSFQFLLNGHFCSEDVSSLGQIRLLNAIKVPEFVSQSN